MSKYAKEMITEEVIPAIKKAGFRVFLAEQGDYGFFTDAAGSKIVSFGVELMRLNYSGNYVTDDQKNTGQGWRLSNDDTPAPKHTDFMSLFNSYPPRWAVGDAKWTFKTMKQHLDFYQKSSQYTEV